MVGKRIVKSIHLHGVRENKNRQRYRKETGNIKGSSAGCLSMENFVTCLQRIFPKMCHKNFHM